MKRINLWLLPFYFLLCRPAWVQDSGGQYTDPRLISWSLSVGSAALMDDSPAFMPMLQDGIRFDHGNLDSVVYGGGVFRQFNPYFSVGALFRITGDEYRSSTHLVDPQEEVVLTRTINLEQQMLGIELIITPWEAYRGSGKALRTKAFIPYGALGAGAMKWDFDLWGDFEDEPPGAVFQAHYRDDRMTTYFSYGIGCRVNLSRYIDLDASIRHAHSSDQVDLGQYYPLDLELSRQLLELTLIWRY